jgi:hypothetical protein
VFGSLLLFHDRLTTTDFGMTDNSADFNIDIGDLSIEFGVLFA